jgi:hypothetical protein
MSFGEIVFALVMSGIVGLWVYGIIITDGDTIRRILWDDTMLGWGWRKLFGKKKKAKQAPIGYPKHPGGGGWYSAPPPPAMPTAFNTSSLNVPPINNIGKPLTIQNWDRLTGMMVNVLSRRWIVTQAMHTLSGYECVLQTAGIAHTINVCIYGDMYDSHRVSVFCKGKVAHIDIGVCKDPNALLHSIAVEFTDKFDIWN